MPFEVKSSREVKSVALSADEHELMQKLGKHLQTSLTERVEVTQAATGGQSIYTQFIYTGPQGAITNLQTILRDIRLFKAGGDKDY